MLEYLSSHVYLMALAIFLARICDVSLGTVRTIIVFRGYRLLAAMIGFFEVSIWLLAASRVLSNLNEWPLIIGYAGGFATGNMVGIWLESKLAIGSVVVRVFSYHPALELAKLLRSRDYFVTEVAGKNAEDLAVQVVFVVTKRRELSQLLALIDASDANAVYTVEDVRRLHQGAMQQSGSQHRQKWWNLVNKRK